MQRLPLPKSTGNSNSFTSYSGFAIDQVISALQKTVRRSYVFYNQQEIIVPEDATTNEAIQWGLEMYLTTKSEPDRQVKANRTNVWNRIFVIAVEDIGPANPHLLTNLETLRQQDSAVNLVKAIVLLLNSKKSRVSDWSLHIPIPISIEDGYTVQQLIASCISYKQEHNFSCSLYCLLAVIRSKDIGNLRYTYRTVFPDNEYTLSLLHILDKYYTKNKKVELYMLTIATLFHLWYFDILPTSSGELSTINDEEAQLHIDNHGINLLGIPDCAVDKHTSLGKRKGRNLQHFLTVGSVLYNRDAIWSDLDDYYLDCILKKT